MFRQKTAKRPQKKKTILHRLLLPIVAVMLAQAFLYILVFWKGGVVNHADQNAYDILNERVLGRKQYIENEMVHRWSNLHEHETAILATIEETLQENGASLEDIKTNPQLNEALVSATVEDLIYMLRRNTVTGAFLVLDGPGLSTQEEGETRAGFYIRDLDPTNYSAGNTDILVERGIPSAVKQSSLTMDSYWMPAFSMKDGGPTDFFMKPLTAAKASGNKESSNFGYWCGGFSLNQDDVPVLTYAVPLIAEDGTVIGVLGIDITESYLYSFLNYDELISEKQGAYCIGITDDGGQNFRCIASNGPLYKSRFGSSTVLRSSSVVDGKISRFDTAIGESGPVYGSVQEFKMYNHNTPFEQEQWVLIGLVESRSLLQFSRQIILLVAIATAVSLLLSICGAVAVSKKITAPIASLVGDLKHSDPNRSVRLRKLGIQEIDELTDSIEKLSVSVAESASKISKIITLTKVSIGVFEYGDNADYVFCSGNLFDVLGWESDTDTRENCYVPRSEFDEQMARLHQYLYSRQDGLYRLPLPNGQFRWVQLTTLSENERVLGTASDVTSDMQQKQRMEYERDYDVLTNLYNRRAFEQKLTELFVQGQLKTAALVMWDLDNLKYINDTYGHDYGDRYIVSLSEGLQFFAPFNSLVARRSGDEFYTLLYGYDSKAEIRELISQGWEYVQGRAFMLPNGVDYRVRVSAGFAWYPDDAATVENLIHYADYAMYNIKHTIKGGIQEFNKQSYQQNASILYGQEDFNRLLDERLVRFALQPIYDVNAGEVFGYEFLMRPQLESLKNPQDVLRMAQSQSKLYHIEQLTWYGALETYRDKLQSGEIKPGQKAFINSIGSQLLSDEDIRHMEEEFAPCLGQVVLELMESEPGGAGFFERKIQIINSWGGMVAIDDYGTGYNSEASLIFLSPDVVKLDMSIVRNINTDQNRQDVLSSLMTYVRTRGVKVLAEGVQTREEMETLVEYGVDYLQGYYVGYPALQVSEVQPQIREAIGQAVAKRRHNGVRT